MPAVTAAIIGGGAALGGGYLNGKAGDKKSKADAELYNKFLSQYGTGQAKTLQGLYDSGNNPFGPQVNTTTGSGTSNTFGQTNSVTDSDTHPYASAEDAPLVNMNRKILSQRLQGGGAIPGQAETEAIAINAGTAGAKQSAANAAARFGLSGQQALALNTPIDIARTQQINARAVARPQEAYDRETQTMQLIQSLADAYKGQTGHSTTSGTTRSTTNSSQSGTSTTPPSIRDLLALFTPPAPGQSGQSGQSGAGAGLGDLSKLFAFLYGQGAFGGNGGGYGTTSVEDDPSSVRLAP
jgi:hypothetical protein